MKLIEHVVGAGFPLDANNVIHLFVGGSQLHGAKVTGYDDLDIYGAYIEPPEYILGLKSLEHFVWTSSAEGAKNTAEDVDLTLYSLHRWGELISKGNPSILHFLFATGEIEHCTWLNIVKHRDRFVTKKSARQYLAFANSQRMRLTGEKGTGRHGQRTDLIEKYGYDVKFAMHYIRLLHECLELLQQHRLTLPLPQKDLLIQIRIGQITQNEVFAMGEALNAECNELLERSDLPESIDLDFASSLIADQYREFWTQYR